MTMIHLIATIALAGSFSTIVAFTGITRSPVISSSSSRARLIITALNEKKCNIESTRRETLRAAAISTAFLVNNNKALAFPNKISTKYDDRPKQRGSKPKGLGVSMQKDMTGEEYLGLKPCGAAPNCFCSTDNIEDSPNTNIPSFKWPMKQFTSHEDAFAQLYEVVKSYEPGQENVDGGGFDIVSYDPKAGYIYIQFESLKNGYVDDLEFAFIDRGGSNDKDATTNNAIQVRSSSRLGYLDFGVNAKRINYLATKLRSKGWDAPGVELETHKGYAEENGLKSL